MFVLPIWASVRSFLIKKKMNRPLLDLSASQATLLSLHQPYLANRLFVGTPTTFVTALSFNGDYKHFISS